MRQEPAENDLKARVLMQDVDTPALMLDRGMVERNLDKMAARFDGTRVKLRPHAKTHKSPILARMQLERGAIGICCAKLGEAEAMADEGITELLVTTELVGSMKVARLIDLARRANLTVVVDDGEAATAISRACVEAGLLLPALVDVDVGQHRTGCKPGAPAVALGRLVAALPGLELRGLQGYEGHVQHVVEPSARRAANRAAMTTLGATVHAFAAAGLSTAIVTTGGTGSGIFAAECAEVTDIQAGSYVVMDVEYAGVQGVDFENALTLLSTVVSVRDEVAILDAGYKSLSSDAGAPRAIGVDGTFSFAGDEHGKITSAGPSPLRVGDLVHLIPSHCDTTINLHDEYVVHAGGAVVERWPIAARGCVR